MGNRAGHAPQHEARGAREAFRADDDDIGAEILGCFEQDVRRTARDRLGHDARHAHLSRDASAVRCLLFGLHTIAPSVTSYWSMGPAQPVKSLPLNTGSNPAASCLRRSWFASAGGISRT